MNEQLDYIFEHKDLLEKILGENYAKLHQRYVVKDIEAEEFIRKVELMLDIKSKEVFGLKHGIKK